MINSGLNLGRAPYTEGKEKCKIQITPVNGAIPEDIQKQIRKIQIKIQIRKIKFKIQIHTQKKIQNTNMHV